MKVIFTKHAKARMKEREVTHAEVVGAMAEPEFLTHKSGQTVFKKIRKNGQLLIVYVVQKGSVARIVTVITTSKLLKYLK